MYSGYHTYAPSSNMTQLSNVLLESKVLSMQRESENYIRKVEQEKKHYYNIEEAWQGTKKEWLEKQEKLKKIQHDKSLPASKQQLSKIKNLKHQLDQYILKYNESQTYNGDLKKEINMMRKERAQYLEIHAMIENELVRIEAETAEIDSMSELKQITMEQKKEDIAKLKNKNDQEKMTYVKQFDRLQKEVIEEKKRHDASTMGQRKEKSASIDTSSILKQRLKKLISNNKEKVKLIETYQKNMKVIEDSFNQIKEASGILDIEEIMNTFIKSEEQNYSLYNYVDILSQQIDQLQDQNSDIRKKIDQQNKDNEAKKRLLMATPAAERHRKKNDKIVKEKQSDITDLRKQMEQISPVLKDVLIELSQTTLSNDPTAHLDYKLSFNLNEGSLEKYLQDLEKYIDLTVAQEKIAKKQSVAQTTLLLDEIPPKDFKAPPRQQFNQDEELKKVESEQKHNAELLTAKQLRELALEAIKKKEVKK